MPAKKQKNTPVEIPQEEEVNTEDECFERMEARLTKTFEERFSEFQKAIETIAKEADEPKKTKEPKKQHVPAPRTTYDTRNKALRAHYNPGMEADSDILIQQQGNSTHDSEATAQNAMLRQNPDFNTHDAAPAHAPLEFQPVNIRPSPQTRAAKTAPNVTGDKNKEMNQWLVNNVLPSKTVPSNTRLPISARDMIGNDGLEQAANTILASAATNISRGNARQGLFPFKYIFRGDDIKCAPMNSLSVSDHCWAIMRMIRDESVPAEIKPHLITHVEQVLEDARSYNWATAVRQWSNEIFSRVAEGRLSDGWESYNEIQLLRISISQTSTAKLQAHNEGNPTFRQGQAANNDNMRGGPPCVNFNSQKGCPLPSGHIVNGQKLLHICAYCLFNAAVPRPHAEYYCRNRQRQGASAHF